MMLLILALLLPMALAAAFLLLRHARRHGSDEDQASAVTQQHIELFHGAQLNEAEVEAVKARFRELLERGEVAAVENSLRAGKEYVVQVRALAELGTDDAGCILERQLQRRLTDDQLEQAWYWIDLAASLRTLNRAQSLPLLLRCAESTLHFNLSHVLAAETVCFLGFAGYLRQLDQPLGRSALRVLNRALEGLRHSLQPQVIAEARLGELVEGVWDECEGRIDPLAVCTFREALRLLRRVPHFETFLAGEASEQEAFSWQVSRLAALEPVLTEYLEEAPARLCALLAERPTSEHADILRALAALRAEAGPAVLPLVLRPGYPHAELGLEVLTWSAHPPVGQALRQWALQRVKMLRRAQARRKAQPPSQPSVTDFPYCALLRALRGHPSAQTEDFLLLAARDWDPVVRAAAVGSLGWWEPVQRAEVLLSLQDARRDPSPEVRQAARAALARLGERQALQWFRQSLASEDLQRVQDTVQAIAAENLTLLWPDLDRLADADDPNVAHLAREALERLCEEMPKLR
jgi:hypothetical protein